jgi:hypothetical protein
MGKGHHPQGLRLWEAMPYTRQGLVHPNLALMEGQPPCTLLGDGQGQVEKLVIAFFAQENLRKFKLGYIHFTGGIHCDNSK